jgi:hypothetical protein
MTTLIDRLETAAMNLSDHLQYDDPCEDENGNAILSAEEEAAKACEDAIEMIRIQSRSIEHLAAALQEVKKWTLEDEQTIVDHGEPATIDGCLFLDAETLNERFQTIRRELEMVGL